jgi:hypothetical protein
MLVSPRRNRLTSKTARVKVTCVHARWIVPVAVAALLAGCGGGAGGSAGTGVAHLGSSATSTGTSAGSVSGSLESQALAFAKCMRAHGLPSFPDPSPGGGFEFHKGSGIEPSAPAFEAARAKCKGFAPPGPGSGPPPSAQTLARFLRIAQCMRAHGVPSFPDPVSRVPSNAFGPGGAGVISDIEGVILLFPSTLETQSPRFTHAAAQCGFPLHNH